MTTQIPGPYAWPIVGNMYDVRSSEGISRAQMILADTYGPVYQLTVSGRKIVVISSAEGMKQVTNEKQFIKIPPTAFNNSPGVKDLFTARGDDPDWGQAHRILMPAFGPLPIQEMFGEMKDIASQLCLKWARAGEESQILLTEDFTRLTLDTIALCAMDYRFNSFYQESMHPFVAAMTGVLGYAGKQSSIPWIVKQFAGRQDKIKAYHDSVVMEQTAQGILTYRREHPTKRKDLLNTMLYATDPKTGKIMRDELITANMKTLLVAGHETTSGLLSFAFMQLLKHPVAYLKAQKEVDTILGHRAIQPGHLNHLPYLNAVLRETLRLTPTAPGMTKIVHPDHRDQPTMFRGTEYLLDPDVPVFVLLGRAMSDPTYFGEDADQFNPDRMMEDNPNFDHYMKAWKPFGNGSRSCIGQSFAWQEALLVTALVLQNFDMSLVDADYQLHIYQALTIKPKDLYVRVKLRKGVTSTSLINMLSGHDIITNNGSPNSDQDLPEVAIEALSNKMTILYGSNSGTCFSLAQRLASRAATNCRINTNIASLDTAVNNLPHDQPVIIISATYEGQPPENAARFVEWLTGESSSLEHMKYAVFCCGDSNWQDTLYRIPKLIDSTLENRGAEQIHPTGSSDVSQRNVMDDFSRWQDELLKTISIANGGQSTKDFTDIADQVEICHDKRATRLSNGLKVAVIKEARSLTTPGEPEKRHLEIELPESLTYECGDYLAVLPLNPDQLVKRIMSHWHLPWDSTILVKSRALAPLPEGKDLSIYDVLKGFYELGQQISKRNLESLKSFTTDPKLVAQIDDTIGDKNIFESTIVKGRVSLFEYLTRHRGIDMPFPAFLSSLLPLRIRQYSISSSPLPHPRLCTISYSVARSEAKGPGVLFEGVASTYLSSLRPGDLIQTSVKRTASANTQTPFRLPLSNDTPILMFCAGTGIAPFRGFIEQRAHILSVNKDHQLARAILFVGCRKPAHDQIYLEEFEKWAALGAVDIRYAFSQEPGKSHGCKYVSDRMVRDGEDIVKVWRQGAKVYTCGSRAVLESVKDAADQIFTKSVEDDDQTEKDQKRSVFRQEMSERAVSDIFD